MRSKNRSNSNEWSGKSRGGAFGYSIFIFLIRYSGLRFAYCVLFFVVIYFIPFAPKATRSLWQYYRRILRRSIWAAPFLIYKHYFIFGQTIIDKLAIGTGLGSSATCNKFKFEIPQYKEFMSLVNAGKGFITIGAHIGCWELASYFFKGYEDRINIVMLDAEYQKIKNVVSSSSRPYKIIPITDDFLSTVLNIRNALNRAEMVSFQGDRFVKGQAAFTSQFMGFSADFPAGVFTLVGRLKVPVVFLFVMREQNFTYRIEFVFVDDSASGDIRQLYIKALEDIVRRYPQQWFNFYKFWQ